MPDSPSGVYTLPPSYKVANGDLTDASQHNPPFEDVQQALSNRLHRDGRTAWTGNQNANGNKLTNLADGTSPQDAATVGQAAPQISDYLDTHRNPGAKWLRRNGAVYDASEYPALAALLGPLPSGFIWEELTPPFGTATPNSIASGGGRVAIVAGNTVYWSDDGENWNPVALPITAQAITFGGGRFVVLGPSRAAMSDDGCETWQATGTVLETGVAGGIKYAAGLFAVAHVGPAGDPPAKISTSPDGIVWTTRMTAPDLREYRLLVGDGQGFVARDATFFYVSDDGIDWDEITPDVTIGTLWGGYRLSSGKVVMVGSGGLIQTTTDFETVTTISSGTTSTLMDVTYIDPFLVALGNNSVVRLSDNGGTSFTGSITGTEADLRTSAPSPFNSTELYVIGAGTLLKGTRTVNNQFRVPNDNPSTGWIKALP